MTASYSKVLAFGVFHHVGLGRRLRRVQRGQR